MAINHNSITDIVPGIKNDKLRLMIEEAEGVVARNPEFVSLGRDSIIIRAEEFLAMMKEIYRPKAKTQESPFWQKQPIIAESSHESELMGYLNENPLST